MPFAFAQSPPSATKKERTVLGHSTNIINSDQDRPLKRERSNEQSMHSFSSDAGSGEDVQEGEAQEEEDKPELHGLDFFPPFRRETDE